MPVATHAQSFGDADEGNAIQSSASTKPVLLQGVDYQQHIGSEIPLDDTFTDETGATVSLRNYFGKVPVVLILAYYKCPMLCDRVVSGATAALKQAGHQIGDQFRLLTVSFDPSDTPADAARKKQMYMQLWSDPKAVEGWHFLTGKEPQIRDLTNAVGFHYNYDPKTGMFAHAAGLVVVTPDGKLSKYFYGVTFSHRDLRLALVQSSQEQVGSIGDQLLLFCCTYDPGTGKYHALVSRILKLGATLTILFIAVGLLALRRVAEGPGPPIRRYGRGQVIIAHASTHRRYHGTFSSLQAEAAKRVPHRSLVLRRVGQGPICASAGIYSVRKKCGPNHWDGFPIAR